MRRLHPGQRQFLNALAVGILTFLLWDVLAHAWGPLDGALGDLHEGDAGIGPVFGYGALFFTGLGAGLMSLAYYGRWLDGRGAPVAFGPGAMAAGELAARRQPFATWPAARRLALLIATGIGL